MRGFIVASPFPYATELGGPVGETNLYRTEPRGRVLAIAGSAAGLLRQIGAVLATGNIAVVAPHPSLAGLPSLVASRMVFAAEWQMEENLAGAMVDGSSEQLIKVASVLAAREGPVVPVQSTARSEINLDMLVYEVALSINTAAAGGNASLMALKED